MQGAKCITLFFLLLLFISGCDGTGSGGGTPNSSNPPANNSQGGCFASITTIGGADVTINGKVEYEDKEYGTGGFTGNNYKAVRYAKVDIVNSGDSIPIVSAFTNSSGIYHIPPTTFTNGTSIYLRVNSYTTGNSSSKPDVIVGNMSGTPYAVACDSNLTPQAGTSVTTNLSIPTSSPAAGAFNIMDVFASAGEFVRSLAGINPPTLKAFWADGNPNGTYYCTGCPFPGDGIYVLSETGGDTDEYDDDVLWHEYGHFIADETTGFSKDDSDGGVHNLTSNDLDLRLSWSEGWGDSFPGVVKYWLPSSLLSTVSGTPLSQYVDTTGNTAGISINMGSPGGTPYIYSASEVAVAYILLNLRNAYGMQAIWDIVTSANFKNASPRINLEAFWDTWLLRPGVALELATLESIFGSRAISYKTDSFESDGSPNGSRNLTIGSTEDHTLYNTGDTDVVAFDTILGNKYTITTYDLKNGADTSMALLKPDSTEKKSNDNTSGLTYTPPYNCDGYNICHVNGYDTLGSTIFFNASSVGPYYIKITSSANKPVSAGKYGTYTLKITSP